jgi:hypothetical protein
MATASPAKHTVEQEAEAYAAAQFKKLPDTLAALAARSLMKQAYIAGARRDWLNRVNLKKGK